MNADIPEPNLPLAKGRFYAVLPLRGLVGFGFVAHGCAKLQRGPEVFIVTLQHLGVPMPHLTGWLTLLVELAGGLAVLLGAYTLLACVPLAITLMVAIISVHLPFGFSSIKLQTVTANGPQFGPPGYEMALLYLAALVTFAMSHPSPWSIDAWRERRRSRDGGSAS